MEPLQQWLRLTAEEQTKFKRLNILLQNASAEATTGFLEKLEGGTLIKFLEISPKLVEFCSRSEMAPLLMSHIKEQFERNRLPNTQIEEYAPLTTLQYLQGFYFLQLSLSASNETPDKSFSEAELEYLNKSASFYNFHALHALISYELFLLEKDKTSWKEKINEMLNLATSAAKYHWTPGYILLSKVYRIAYAYSRNVIDGQEALKALIIAKKISSQPESKKQLRMPIAG